MNKYLKNLTDVLDKENIKWVENAEGVFDQIDIVDTSIDVIWYTNDFKMPNDGGNIIVNKEDPKGIYEIAFAPRENTMSLVTERFKDIPELVNRIKALKS